MLRTAAVAIVLLVVVLAQAPQAISTVRSWLDLDDWSWWSQDAVLSPERAQELAAKNLREQVISFNDGMKPIQARRLGTENQRYDLYAIGVGQVTLKEPESANVEAIVVTSSELEKIQSKQPLLETPTTAIEGQFNNVLVFDRRTGEFTKVFDKRVSISAFQYGWRTTPEVLVLFAAERDTDKDGTIDDEDLHDIYVFTFADKKLHRIEASNINPKELMDVPDVDYLVIKAIYDRDKDGITSAYRTRDKQPDPSVLIRVDLKTFAAASFVPDAMTTDLQKTLDGPKPAAAGAQ